MKKINNDIFYCGLNDVNRKMFDELIPLEHGTSYNSYLIKGSEKTAVIDAMYSPKTEEYLQMFDKAVIDNIDYIILNHGEQDHSGSIPAMLKKYPNAIVVTNAKCADNIKNMLFVPSEKIKVITDGEELALGNYTLKFILAPGVHWPDTMFTLIKENGYLFTCDFLGAHYTFDEIFADESEELMRSAKRYYSEIMMPFRTMCKKYTALIRSMSPKMILPSHGTIYRNPDFILDLYEDWSGEDGKNLVVIPYVSMYGSTKEMANYLSQQLNKLNIKTVLHDMVSDDLGNLAIALVDATTIVIGAPMVLAGAHPAAVNIAALTGVLRPKAKFASFIGSFGWGGKLTDKMAQSLSGLKLELIAPVIAKGKPMPETFAQLEILAKTIFEKHSAVKLL